MNYQFFENPTNYFNISHELDSMSILEKLTSYVAIQCLALYGAHTRYSRFCTDQFIHSSRYFNKIYILDFIASFNVSFLQSLKFVCIAYY